MTPNQLTQYLEHLNTIDRAVSVSKKATYEAIDTFRAFLIGSVETTTGSAADVWAQAQMASALGTMDPANENPGTGAWNFAANMMLTRAEQRMIAHDSVEGEDEDT